MNDARVEGSDVKLVECHAHPEEREHEGRNSPGVELDAGGEEKQ